MDKLNRYDTREKRGCFAISMLFGLILALACVLVPAWSRELALGTAGVLIVAGFRWLVATILDWIYA